MANFRYTIRYVEPEGDVDDYGGKIYIGDCTRLLGLDKDDSDAILECVDFGSDVEDVLDYIEAWEEYASNPRCPHGNEAEHCYWCDPAFDAPDVDDMED